LSPLFCPEEVGAIHTLVRGTSLRHYSEGLFIIVRARREFRPRQEGLLPSSEGGGRGRGSLPKGREKRECKNPG